MFLIVLSENISSKYANVSTIMGVCVPQVSTLQRDSSLQNLRTMQDNRTLQDRTTSLRRSMSTRPLPPTPATFTCKRHSCVGFYNHGFIRQLCFASHNTKIHHQPQRLLEYYFSSCNSFVCFIQIFLREIYVIVFYIANRSDMSASPIGSPPPLSPKIQPSANLRQRYQQHQMIMRGTSPNIPLSVSDSPSEHQVS